MATRFFKFKPLTLVKQGYLVSVTHPEFRVTYKRALLACEGVIKPTAMSKEYLVKITYRLNHHPEVTVLRPTLHARPDGTPVPHTYEGGRLCLYTPGLGEWDPGKHIAETILPWTSLWLYFYEVWLVSGEWLGGGEHPNWADKKRRYI